MQIEINWLIDWLIGYYFAWPNQAPKVITLKLFTFDWTFRIEVITST